MFMNPERDEMLFMVGRYSMLKEFGSPEQLRHYLDVIAVCHRQDPDAIDVMERRLYGQTVGLSIGQFNDERAEPAPLNEEDAPDVEIGGMLAYELGRLTGYVRQGQEIAAKALREDIAERYDYTPAQIEALRKGMHEREK